MKIDRMQNSGENLLKIFHEFVKLQNFLYLTKLNRNVCRADLQKSKFFVILWCLQNNFSDSGKKPSFAQLLT
jgi:hypothetical protein